MNLYLLVFLCLKYLRSEELLKFGVFPAPIISSVVFFFFLQKRRTDESFERLVASSFSNSLYTSRCVKEEWLTELKE